MSSTVAEFTPRLAGLNEDERTPTVCVSFGMGLDSSALLARWLTDPSSRDFALDDMVVLTAMTGHESAATISAVTRHLLPLLRAHSVRFIQIARSQRKTTRVGDGVVVLEDSRFPVNFTPKASTLWAMKCVRQQHFRSAGAPGCARFTLRETYWIR